MGYRAHCELGQQASIDVVAGDDGGNVNLAGHRGGREDTWTVRHETVLATDVGAVLPRMIRRRYLSVLNPGYMQRLTRSAWLWPGQAHSG